MTFASTHKEALELAHNALFSDDANLFHASSIEAVLSAYLEARGAQILPVNAPAEMLQEICLVEGFSHQALATRYAAMLSASPDPFTDEVKP